MNFTQLRAFHAVASAGGFTRGAARLGLSQPAVTVQVRALEQAYGVELFRRRGQRTELTEFGREVFRQAQQLFALLDDLEQLLGAARVTAYRQAGAGRRRAIRRDGHLLAAFLQRHPGVRVTMRLGNARRALADLREGHTELAMLNLIGHSHDLFNLPLLRDRLVALVRAGHEWAEGAAVALNALSAAPLIVREPGSAIRALLTDAFAAADLAPRVALELGSREAVREAVLAGLDVGIVFARELVPDPGLQSLAIRGADLGATVSLVCLAERRELRAVAAFFEVAHEVIARSNQAAAF